MPDCIFISYSHKLRGPEWKHRLIAELAFFEKHGLIAAWDDEQIPAGARWEKEIADAIQNARLAVILLTKEALESEFILQRELVPLQQREKDGVIVIPVNCGCEDKEYRHHDWIKTLQIRPFEAKPLSSIADRVELQRVIRRLATEISKELGRSALAQISPATTEPRVVRVYLDKFPLTLSPSLREEKLIGREQELTLLDLAFVQPHTAIVSLVAWGGVGKTMLVQHWLQRLQRDGWFGSRRVYAWSFYSQGTKEDRQASEDMFLAHALEWFGVQCEPTLAPWDKGRVLADAVARERTILILDGIEPLQYPPGPLGGQLRKVGEDESHLRAPGVQSLLKHLARKANAGEQQGLCLVTTRVWLADLSDFQRREGSPWGSVLRVDLGNLTDEAGAALLHHAGANRDRAVEIKPDDKELLTTSHQVDGHALTLNLLGRFLARAHGGNIRHRDLVNFEEADRKEQGGTTFKMLAAFEKWFAKSGEFGARQLAVLRILGIFDRPAEAGCVAALRRPPVIDGLTDPLFQTTIDSNTGQSTTQQLVEEEWNTVTSFLADFGLLSINGSHDSSEPLLDAHPLIREYFESSLRTRNMHAASQAHQRLCDHMVADFDSKSGPGLEFEEFEPIFRAVRHGCAAGKPQFAFEHIYEKRIQKGREHFARNRYGCFGEDFSALAALLELPSFMPVAALDSQSRGQILVHAGFYLRVLGRLADAIQVCNLGLESSLIAGDTDSAARSAVNLAEANLTVGMISAAESTGRAAVRFADESGDQFLRMYTRMSLADTLHQGSGRPWKAAAELFAQSEEIQASREPKRPLLYSHWGYLFNELLFDLNELEAIERRVMHTVEWAKADGARSRRWRGLDELCLARLHSIRSVGQVPSEVNALTATIDHALSNVMSFGQQQEKPAALLFRAEQRCLVGCLIGAQADLDEAWDIAERGPMRLHMADIYLHRARLFFREKAYPWKSPQADLAAAEKLINDCGYHRHDEDLADAKRAIL